MFDHVSGASGFSRDVYVDVRPEAAWESGHVKIAMHHELEDMQMGLLPSLPKDTRIVLYGTTREEAETARSVLQRAGFYRLRNAGTLEEAQSERYKKEEDIEEFT